MADAFAPFSIMTLIGLTGGIGMGKSTVMTYFKGLGYPAVDTDDLARDLVAPGGECLKEVISAFGSRVLASDGALDRGALARIVFSDRDQLRLLESILHPRIRMLWKSQAQQWKQDGYRFALVAIPLLYETASETMFDSVVAVGCSESTQIERLKARGWDEEEIRRRSRAQWTAVRKMDAADYVIWTEGRKESITEQWIKLLPMERVDGTR
jgi:dephospho-CoA kinase